MTFEPVVGESSPLASLVELAIVRGTVITLVEDNFFTPTSLPSLNIAKIRGVAKIRALGRSNHGRTDHRRPGEVSEGGSEEEVVPNDYESKISQVVRWSSGRRGS